MLVQFLQPLLDFIGFSTVADAILLVILIVLLLKL